MGCYSNEISSIQNGFVLTLQLFDLKYSHIPGGTFNSEKSFSARCCGKEPESLQCQEINRGLHYWPGHSGLYLPARTLGNDQASLWKERSSA